MADYVTGPAITRGGDRRGSVLMLPTLSKSSLQANSKAFQDFTSAMQPPTDCSRSPLSSRYRFNMMTPSSGPSARNAHSTFSFKRSCVDRHDGAYR